MSRWTTAAWAATGRRARLLYATTPPGFGARNRAIHERLRAFEPGLPRETPAHRMAMRYVLPPRELDRKIAALRAHDSQIGPIERLIGPDALRAWWAEECFAEYAGPAR